MTTDSRTNRIAASHEFFLTKLYPMQDEVLHIIAQQQTGFYLTGGTALSRGYLDHRFSEDLDLFTNLSPNFSHWCSLIVAVLNAVPQWHVDVQRRGQYFLRLFVSRGDVTLKVECVNDVPSHIGDLHQHAVLGLLDSPENILANKVTALMDRDEPRDIADVWGLCTHLGLSLVTAITDAKSKAAGQYPADVARRLCQVTRRDWQDVMWKSPPDPDEYLAEVIRLGESLILI